MIQTKNNNVEARVLFERAIAISPDFAAPQAYIAFTLLNDYVMGAGDVQSLQSGLQTAARAIEMDEGDRRRISPKVSLGPVALS
jgi:hypothetical protein